MVPQDQSNLVHSPQNRTPDAQLATLSAKVLNSLNDGRIADAAVTQHELVQILRSLAGESHWQTISELILLKEIERVSGLNEEQRNTYTAARQRLLDGMNKRTAADYDDAQESLSRALDGFGSIFGENAVSVVLTLEQLGILSLDLMTENFSAAKRYFSRATAICRALYGDDHPAHAYGLMMVGSTCLEANDLDDAETLFREAMSRDRRVFGVRSLRYANLLQKLSSTMVEKMKFLEAEAMSLQAISIAEEAHNRDPILMASCLNNLAHVSSAYEDNKDAYAYLRRSLMFYERGLPPQSLPLARVFDRYSPLLRRLDRSHEAKVMEARAKAIRANAISKRPSL